VHQFLTFGTIFGKTKKSKEDPTDSIKSQMEKDFERIKHQGLFEEYLEMGWSFVFLYFTKLNKTSKQFYALSFAIWFYNIFCSRFSSSSTLCLA
jgi:hypothetical protein